MQSTRLDPVELGAWRGFLRAHAALIKELDAELQAEHGLPLSSYEVLLTLASAEEDKLRMSEIADSVLLSRSGLTRLCDRLERDGLIERSECSTDRRGAYARLTGEGRRRFAAAQETHLAGVRRAFLERLTEKDLRRLADVWETVSPGAANAG
ncbi:MAG: MarR family transcriptional regulator [Thermoleophilaceae bacterium]